MKIEVKLYGQLKECFASPHLILELAGESFLVKDLKHEILQMSGASERARDLVADSVLATEARILRDDENISGGGVVLLLPPVCGG